jgi:hypothetical protein
MISLRDRNKCVVKSSFIIYTVSSDYKITKFWKQAKLGMIL